MGKMIKICGLTHRNHVVHCIREGVEFMGVVFAEKSHRYMGDSLDEVKAMTSLAREKGFEGASDVWGCLPQVFGIFLKGAAPVEEEAKAINATVADCGLHGAQLFGYTSEDYESMKPHFDNVPSVIFTVSVSTASDVQKLSVPTDARVKAVCIDNKMDAASASASGCAEGGTGKAFDWSWLESVDPAVLQRRKEEGLQIFLAGGVTAENAESAAKISCVDVVDVSSGCEINKKKDGRLMRKLARTVRGKLPSYFGRFGGQFIPEILMPNLIELEEKYLALQADDTFQKEVSRWNKEYTGRPTLLYYAERLTKQTGGAHIWLKREDLCHGGAHKINNGIGQALVAKALGKKRIIAETGAGQHGVATATVCALFELDGTVYMGEKDTQRQRLNVLRMESMGTKVVPAVSGARTLNAAVNEAFRDWAANPGSAHYLIGSVVGPHPFPTIVRDFQSVISQEAREQFMAQNGGSLPDMVVACCGGGSNCIGAFDSFVNDPNVELVGVEAGGDGEELHSATLTQGTTGWLHGARTKLLQTKDGQVMDTHSISAGLDYPAVGPEHAYLLDSGRARYVMCTDQQALEGFKLLAKTEGVLPALETSHAVYKGVEIARSMPKDKHIVICISGRGDKDMETIGKALGFDL